MGAFTDPELDYLNTQPLMRFASASPQGRPDVAPVEHSATLGADVDANGPRTHYMRARLKDGVITPFERQDSALIGILTQANALLIRPMGDGAQAKGAAARYIALSTA